MTIRFACDCGQQLAAADEHAGKRVKCSACGGIQTVPATARPRPAVAAPPAARASQSAPFRFECDCGQACQARPEHAGKKTKCPRCGKLLTIPSPDEPEAVEELDEPRPRRPASVTADRPVARAGRRAAVDEDEDRPRRRGREEDDYEEDEDRPRKRKKKGGAKKWIFIGAGVAAVAGIALLLWLLLGGGISSDFDLVPRDAPAFATVRVADLLKTPVGKKLMDKLGDQKQHLTEVEKKFGVSLQDVERVTAVFLDVEKPSWYVIIQTSKAVDKNKILKELGNASEKKHEGKTYHAETGGKDAIYFASDKLIVIGAETNVKKAMEVKKKSGPLDDALKLASKSKYQIAGGFNIPSSLVNQAKAGAGMVPGAADLLTVKSVAGAMAVSDSIEIVARAYFPDSSKAKSAADSLKTIMNLGKGFAPKEAAALTKIPDPKQSGKAVEITWKVEKGDVDSLIDVGTKQILTDLGGGRRQRVGGGKLTDANVQRVVNGMTVQQVEAILGKGRVTGFGGTDIYSWEEGGKAVNVTVEKGKVIRITKFGFDRPGGGSGPGGGKLTAANVSKLGLNTTLADAEALFGRGRATQKGKGGDVYEWNEGTKRLIITFTNGKLTSFSKLGTGW